VDAIAASLGLAKVALYLIDAERPLGESGLPVAGLTVVAFVNNHLVYALTWGALAVWRLWPRRARSLSTWTWFRTR
jgi:surfeit locus 1 family protein